MRFTLKDYQVTATNDLVKVLRRDTKERMQDDEEFYSVALSAPTGAGKTVIASRSSRPCSTAPEASPKTPTR